MNQPTHRTITLTILWIVGTAVAVLIAWQGVSIVGDEVTDDRPVALSAGEIEDRLESTSTTVSPSDDEEDGSDDSSSPSTSVPSSTDPSSSPTSVPSTAPSTTAPSTTAPSTSTPSSTVPSSSSTTVPSTTAAASETRTYNLVGGSVSLRFEPTGVTVVYARPNPGFTVETEPEHVNGVKVEFESDSHRSRVDGWWDGGPVDRVREEPR